MQNTTHLQLPLVAAQQAQKHVPVNEALSTLDALIHLAVLDRDLLAPPATPSAGALYIVPPAAVGAWASQAGAVALFLDGWTFHRPRAGWRCWVVDEAAMLLFDGLAWRPMPVGPRASVLGVAGDADAENRLVVQSPASLFNHAGLGHRLKINKAAPAQSATLLFQSAFSGRAEIGLAGQDDLSVKTSGDGASWIDAIRVEAATGRVLFPQGSVRERIPAIRTYHVAPGGSDAANDGLSPASAFATVQRALAEAMRLDPGAHDIVVQLADGAYPAPIVLRGTLPGAGVVHLRGNPAQPQNVTLSAVGQDVVRVQGRATLRLSGLTLQNSGSGSCVAADTLSTVHVGPGLRFGPCAQAHVSAASGAVVRFDDAVAVAIVGGAQRHAWATTGGAILASGSVWTLSGTPAFSLGFAGAASCGVIDWASPAFAGSATGPRFAVSANGVINTYSGNAALLPGNAAGTAVTGGQYG